MLGKQLYMAIIYMLILSGALCGCDGRNQKDSHPEVAEQPPSPREGGAVHQERQNVAPSPPDADQPEIIHRSMTSEERDKLRSRIVSNPAFSGVVNNELSVDFLRSASSEENVERPTSNIPIADGEIPHYDAEELDKELGGDELKARSFKDRTIEVTGRYRSNKIVKDPSGREAVIVTFQGFADLFEIAHIKCLIYDTEAVMKLKPKDKITVRGKVVLVNKDNIALNAKIVK